MQSRVAPARWDFRCLPPNYIIIVSTVIELWTQIEASNSQATSKAHFVKKVERLNRCQDCPLNRSVPEFPLDVQELK